MMTGAEVLLLVGRWICALLLHAGVVVLALWCMVHMLCDFPLLARRSLLLRAVIAIKWAFVHPLDHFALDGKVRFLRQTVCQLAVARICCIKV